MVVHMTGPTTCDKNELPISLTSVILKRTDRVVHLTYHGHNYPQQHGFVEQDPVKQTSPPSWMTHPKAIEERTATQTSVWTLNLWIMVCQ